jgi:phospholipase/lecithinase/hemolysin
MGQFRLSPNAVPEFYAELVTQPRRPNSTDVRFFADDVRPTTLLHHSGGAI